MAHSDMRLYDNQEIVSLFIAWIPYSMTIKIAKLSYLKVNDHAILIKVVNSSNLSQKIVVFAINQLYFLVTRNCFVLGFCKEPVFITI